MTFNHNDFATALDDQPNISINKKWYQWSGTSGDLNQTMEYIKDNYTYRTWYHETSVMKGSIGMLVSCKIDFERTGGDDHITLLTGYSKVPTGMGDNYTIEMKFAQASVQFHGNEDKNIVGAPVTTGDMAQGIYDSLNAILSDNFGELNDSTEGRQTLPDIARINIQAMQQAAEN